MTTHEVNNHQVLQSLSPLQMWNNITAAPIITEIPSEAYVVLQKLAAKWTDILDARDLSLEQLKGAMTNKVYACQWERDNGNRPRKVLVRVYGGASDLFFNRADEVLTFERMSQKNQGPRLLGRFPNGRVEEVPSAISFEP
jgi:choline/ethanolamine kinase